jgi:CRISPR-associated protein (TIGR02584 family)
MTPTQPHTYPRRVLLMVTGRSPQVVTETLYALCRDQDPPFVPTEVQVITTSEGAQDARLSLLLEDPGWFHRLCRDW